MVALNKTLLRVAYYRPHQMNPPLHFPCSSNHLNDYKRCPNPGQDYEVLDIITKYLGWQVKPIWYFENLTCGVDYDIQVGTYDSWHLLNIRASGMVYQSPLSVVSCRKTIDGYGLESVFASFHWPVWLAFLAIVLVARLYVVALRLTNNVRDQHVHFNAVLLPITFGVMLLTGLYRSQLLTNLLIVKERYLIENMIDLLKLPSQVKIYGDPMQWSRSLDNLAYEENKAAAQLSQLVVQKTLFQVIADEVVDCQAVYLNDAAVTSYIESTCPVHLRAVHFSVPQRWSFGFPNSSGYDDIMRKFNSGLIHLRPAIETIEQKYRDYNAIIEKYCPESPGAVGSYLLSDDRTKLSLTEIRGCFGVLVTGMAVAAISVLFERLIALYG